MEVPLSVTPIVKFNKEKLKIWHDGKSTVINAPIKPYYYSYKKNLVTGVEISPVRAKALSSMQEKTFYKYEFNTRDDLVKNRVPGGTFEDNIPFVIRNRLDNPELYRKYPHRNELKFLFVDIEQYCKPEEPFPTYNDRIISIAWCTNDRVVKCAYLKKDNPSDKKLLQLFLKVYERINPDVIVLFNKKYDMPTIIRRCERNKIDTSRFSRSKQKPTFHTGGFISLDGVLIYDIFDSASSDQSLSGNVVNRGLKEVSDFYGFAKEKEPLDMKKIHEYVGTKELIGYNKDDVRRSLLLFDIYWPGIEYNANDLGMPLGDCIGMNITDLGLITVGDKYRENNIISDGKNEDRYPNIFKRKKESGEGNYQGALVDIFRTGVFEPSYKEDYGCFDEKAEALTNHGWKKYFEITKDDKLVTWDAKEDRFDLEIPEKINVYDYEGEMMHSETRHISLFSTPNHRVYHYKLRYKKDKKLDNVYVGRADSLSTFIDIPINSFLREKESIKVSEEQERFLEVIPWVITESHDTGSDLTIYQNLDGKYTPLIRNILDKAKVNYREYCRGKNSNHFSIRSKDRHKIMNVMNNQSRRIPNFVFWLDYDGRVEFLKHLIRGDGSHQNWDSMVFVSKHKKLMDDVQMLSTLTGYRTTLYLYFDKRNNTQCYYLHIYKRRITGLRLNQNCPTKSLLYRREYYKGKVWCPTTKNKTWVCRRNDKIHVTGNSMYPTIMSEFNLSPDTTTFLGFELYGKFKIVEEQNWFIYYIPDNVLNKTMIIQVSKTKQGFLSELVKRFLKERSEYKKIYKKTKKRSYKAMSDNRKVKANGGAYGIQGSGKHAYGFLPIAIATTGIGRECAQLLIDVLEELYPKSTIEVDTDGVYFSASNVDADKIQEMFNTRLKETFKKDLKLSIDLDDYPAGYFYKMKNYVLKREDGELIFHGGAMKARNKSLLKKNLIKEIATAKFSKKSVQPIISKYMKLDFPLINFAMNITLGRHMTQYKNPESTLGSRLAIDAKRKLGIKPEIGNTYYYVKTNGGFKLLELVDKSMIDREYYKKDIKKIVEMFKEQVIDATVDGWL